MQSHADDQWVANNVVLDEWIWDKLRETKNMIDRDHDGTLFSYLDPIAVRALEGPPQGKQHDRCYLQHSHCNELGHQTRVEED